MLDHTLVILIVVEGFRFVVFAAKRTVDLSLRNILWNKKDSLNDVIQTEKYGQYQITKGPNDCFPHYGKLWSKKVMILKKLKIR